MLLATQGEINLLSESMGKRSLLNDRCLNSVVAAVSSARTHRALISLLSCNKMTKKRGALGLLCFRFQDVRESIPKGMRKSRVSENGILCF